METKVTVMTDGWMKHPVDAILEETAEAHGATSIRLLKNGVSTLFSNPASGSAFKEAVLAEPRLKGKLANLSIGDAS